MNRDTVKAFLLDALNDTTMRLVILNNDVETESKYVLWTDYLLVPPTEEKLWKTIYDELVHYDTCKIIITSNVGHPIIYLVITKAIWNDYGDL